MSTITDLVARAAVRNALRPDSRCFVNQLVALPDGNVYFGVTKNAEFVKNLSNPEALAAKGIDSQETFADKFTEKFLQLNNRTLLGLFKDMLVSAEVDCHLGVYGEAYYIHNGVAALLFWYENEMPALEVELLLANQRVAS